MNSSASSLAVISALVLLSGCTTQAPPRVNATRVKQFAGRGYLTDDRYSIATTFSNWRVGGYSFDIAWTMPVSGTMLPIVVYLPGLGETRTSGADWRTAWAQAGYAVVSLQLLEEDHMAWSSGAARRGDFGVLARERYAHDAATARLKALAALLGELQKRHSDGDPTLRRLDLSRVAVAGFDVGAHASMLIAGETRNGQAEPIPMPISFSAIIALSPYADFSGPALGTRYQSITLPVLSISGDADAAGLVSSPSVRKAPFEYMPSRDAYLLWLANATHSALSGSAPGAGAERAETAARRADGRSSRRDGSRREGQGGGSASPGSAKGGGARRGGAKTHDPAASPTDRAMSVSLIQGVTTAFLDTYLKHDTFAAEWLNKDTRRWIGDRGELKRK